MEARRHANVDRSIAGRKRDPLRRRRVADPDSREVPRLRPVPVPRLDLDLRTTDNADRGRAHQRHRAQHFERNTRGLDDVDHGRVTLLPALDGTPAASIPRPGQEPRPPAIPAPGFGPLCALLSTTQRRRPPGRSGAFNAARRAPAWRRATYAARWATYAARASSSIPRGGASRSSKTWFNRPITCR